MPDFKPVILDSERCNGCVACMKRCPTEAIRVRSGKATIRYERCIGCGECVKVCPTQAKKENYDSFELPHDYEYTVCLFPPSLYGQFNNLADIDYVPEGLKRLGFSEVSEIGVGAELVSAATKEHLKKSDTVRPLISSACPAVKELIMMRYGHLIGHLSPAKMPEKVAAQIAVTEALSKTGLPREKIGIFVIAECAAKVAALKEGALNGNIDRVLSVKEAYFHLLAEMNKLKGNPVPQASKVGKTGIRWGSTAGEAGGLGIDNYLCCDGMENVIQILNELEYDNLKSLDFLELYTCPSGCVGGSMNVANPFLARTRLLRLANDAAESVTDPKGFPETVMSEKYETKEVFKLSDSRAEAFRLTCRMKEIYEALPGLDCGACGAPSCKALAEDVAVGQKGVRCRYLDKKEWEKQNDGE